MVLCSEEARGGAVGKYPQEHQLLRSFSCFPQEKTASNGARQSFCRPNSSKKEWEESEVEEEEKEGKLGGGSGGALGEAEGLGGGSKEAGGK